MIKIYSNQNIVDPLTIVLSSRDQSHLGQLSNVSNVKFTGHMNAADELSFIVNKHADDNEELLWDEITDLKLLWIKELNEYFEMNVTLSDKTYLEKTIIAKSLCESELSQSILHNIEINTELDISRDDYDVKYPTIFYRDLSGLSGEDYTKARNSSLLHRILDKVPAYTIGHVDASLANLQRTFSISETSIYDWLIGECSEAFNCLFIFNSLNRTVEAYDLYSNCNTCGHRGDFVDTCPICGSTDITYGYGNDTEIFCTTENLTNQIDFNTDVGSIKNCFRLVAGDDDMTAAVININPNGSQYIYKFSDESLRDMPAELVEKLEDYDELYNDYRTTHEFTLDPLPEKEIDGVDVNFNDLVTKYDDAFYLARDKHLIEMPEPPDTFAGYTNLMKYVYCGYELQSYLQSGMMPVSYTHGAVNASTEAAKINRGDMGNYISLTSFTTATSVKTVESALTNYAKVFVKTGYVKLQINTDSFVNNGSSGVWTGYFTISNYSDENDIVDTIHFSMAVNADYATFMQQKIAKQIVNSTKEEHDSIYNVLRPENTLAEFKEAITYYSLARIESFRDALNAVLSVLQEARQASVEADLYESHYLPYYRKYLAACDEFNLRAQEIDLCEETLSMLLKVRSDIQDALNFKKYLDPTPLTNYYELLTTYIREDDYNNSNYIAEGLDNDQLFANAQEFFEAAEQELIKSSFYQHSITANLYNLLLLKEFEPLKDKFELGNWIRVGIDDNIYRLRLISYSIDYDNLTNLTTEFSDLTRTADGYNDVKSVIKQAQTMATSYNAVTKQAESGQDASEYINSMITTGLSTINSKLRNNNAEEITITAAGIVGRSYDDITETFSPKQVRLTHNILAFTKDNWETVETALGEITYTDTHGQLITDYGLMAKIVISGYIYGSTIEGGKIISAHIQNADDSSYMDLTNATEDESHNPIYFLKSNDNFTVDKTGKIKSTGGIFTNSDDSSYINLSGYYSEYPYYLKYLDVLTIDQDGKFVNKSGIYTNIDDSSYINLSGIFTDYDATNVISDASKFDSFYTSRNWGTAGVEAHIDVYDIVDESTFAGTAELKFRIDGVTTSLEVIDLHEGMNTFETKLMPSNDSSAYYIIYCYRNEGSVYTRRVFVKNGNNYNNYLKFGDRLSIDTYGRILSKSGIFSNQDKSSYLNLNKKYRLLDINFSLEHQTSITKDFLASSLNLEKPRTLYVNIDDDSAYSYIGWMYLYRGGTTSDKLLETKNLHRSLNFFETKIQPEFNERYYVKISLSSSSGTNTNINIYIDSDYTNIFQVYDDFVIDKDGNVKAKGDLNADNLFADGGLITGTEFRAYNGNTYLNQNGTLAGGGSNNLYNFNWFRTTSSGSYAINLLEDERIHVDITNVGEGTLDASASLWYSDDNASTFVEEYRMPLQYGSNIIDIPIYNTSHTIYRVKCHSYDGPGYTAHVYIKKPHTVIDTNGLRSSIGKFTGGEIAGYTINQDNGFFYNKNNIYSEYSVNKCHVGGLWPAGTSGSTYGYWTFVAFGNQGEFIHNDYGSSNVGGLWITGNGANNVYDFSGGAMHIMKSSVSCDAHGEVQWSGSDEKLKQNIEYLTIEESKELIKNVVERKFEFKTEPGKKRYGFIAQEIRNILPDDSGIEFVVEDICNINYNDFIAPLCMIVKDQQDQIDKLKQRIEQLNIIDQK